MNNSKTTKKLVGLHNEFSFLRTIIEGRMKGKRQYWNTENDVIGLDGERGLHQVEGESCTSW